MQTLVSLVLKLSFDGALKISIVFKIVLTISKKIVKKEKHEELSLLKVSGTENLIFFQGYLIKSNYFYKGIIVSKSNLRKWPIQALSTFAASKSDVQFAEPNCLFS